MAPQLFSYSHLESEYKMSSAKTEQLFVTPSSAQKTPHQEEQKQQQQVSSSTPAQPEPARSPNINPNPKIESTLSPTEPTRSIPSPKAETSRSSTLPQSEVIINPNPSPPRVVGVTLVQQERYLPRIVGVQERSPLSSLPSNTPEPPRIVGATLNSQIKQTSAQQSTSVISSNNLVQENINIKKSEQIKSISSSSSNNNYNNKKIVTDKSSSSTTSSSSSSTIVIVEKENSENIIGVSDNKSETKIVKNNNSNIIINSKSEVKEGDNVVQVTETVSSAGATGTGYRLRGGGGGNTTSSTTSTTTTTTTTNNSAPPPTVTTSSSNSNPQTPSSSVIPTALAVTATSNNKNSSSAVSSNKEAVSSSGSGGNNNAMAAVVAVQRTNNKPCCFCWCCCCTCSCLAVKSGDELSSKNKEANYLDSLTCDGEPPPTLEDIRSWGHSFDRLMKSAAGRKVFRDFLKCEYSEENILFWLACEELKRESNPEVVEEKARFIYEDYISILSPKEVSLDSRVREIVNKNMVDPTPHTFDEAQLQIYTLMHRDSYPRFINSHIFKRLAQINNNSSMAPQCAGSSNSPTGGSTSQQGTSSRKESFA